MTAIALVAGRGKEMRRRVDMLVGGKMVRSISVEIEAGHSESDAIAAAVRVSAAGSFQRRGQFQGVNAAPIGFGYRG